MSRRGRRTPAAASPASSSASERRPARRCRPGRGRRTPASRSPAGRRRRWRRPPRTRRSAPWICSTTSPSETSTVWVAPNFLASSSFRASVSTAMMVCAPTSADPAMAASPTPPQPMTATESLRVTAPVLMAAPIPAITPQPSRSGHLRRHVRVDLGALAGGDQGLLDEGADAQRRGQHGAVRERHLLLWRCAWRSSTRAGRACRPGRTRTRRASSGSRNHRGRRR